MYIPKWLTVYGDRSFRGKCPREIEDQASFFTWLWREIPEYAALTFHPKIEGRRSHAQAVIDRKTGSMVKGVADIIAIGSPPLIIELKRKDESDSAWSDGQLKFLERAYDSGAYVCVAFGLDAAKEAYLDWVKEQSSNYNDSSVVVKHCNPNAYSRYGGYESNIDCDKSCLTTAEWAKKLYPQEPQY